MSLCSQNLPPFPLPVCARVCLFTRSQFWSGENFVILFEKYSHLNLIEGGVSLHDTQSFVHMLKMSLHLK
jgi:hypothetical protein